MSQSPRLLRPGAKGFNPRSISGLALWLDGADTSRLYTSDAGEVVLPPGWSPNQVSTQIAGWWAADSEVGEVIFLDENGKVTNVDDISGAGSNATQILYPLSRPLLIANVLNGKPVFRFNGSAGLTGAFGYEALGPNRTVFAVCKISASLTNQRVFSVSSSVGGADFATGQSIPVLANGGSLTQLSSYGSLASSSPVGDFSQFAIFTNTTTSTAITNFGNGLAGATAAISTTVDGDLFGIGCTAHDQSAKFTGDIAEIIAYSGLCNATERAMVEKWLANKYNISGVHRSAAQEIAAVTSPTEMGGCVGWWDSSDAASVTRDGSNLVSQWSDKSGNGRHLTQSDAARKPTYSTAAVNGLNAIVWPTTANGCQLDYLTAFTHQTVIVVCRYADGVSTGFAGTQGLLSTTSALGLLFDSTTWYGAHPFATSFNFVRINGAAPVRVDATTALPMPLRILTCRRDTAATQALLIGSERNNATRGWSGPICEVIAFDRELTTNEALRVEKYLQQKWATPTVPDPTPPVGYWGDKSGNGRHAVQATAGNRPTRSVAINTRSAVLLANGAVQRLTANGVYMDALGDDTNKRITILATLQSSSQSQQKSIGEVDQGSGFGCYHNISNIAYFDAGAGAPASRASGALAVSAITGGSVFSGRRDGGAVDQWYNGVLIAGSITSATGSLRTAGDNPFSVKAVNSGSLAYGEVLVYNRALTNAERQRAERYLAARWGITLAPQVSNLDAQDWINRVYANGGTVSAATAAAVNQFCETIAAAGSLRNRFIRLNLFAGSFQGAFIPLYRTPDATVTNLFQYGTDMSNAAWLGGGNGSFTRTVSTEVGPLGYGIATKLITPTTGGGALVRQMYQLLPVQNRQVTFSVWLKTNTGTKNIQWMINGEYLEEFTVTTTWARYTKTYTSTASANDGRTALVSVVELNDAGHILAWGMQCEYGATATAYNQPVYGNATDTNLGSPSFLSTDYSESNGLQAMTEAQAAGATAATKYLNCGAVFAGLASHYDSHLAADIKLHNGATYAQMPIIQVFADSVPAESYFSQHRFSLTSARGLEHISGGVGQINRTSLAEGVRHFVLSSRTDISTHAAYLNGGSAIAGGAINAGRLVSSTAELAPFANWNGAPAATYRHIMSAYSFGRGLSAGEALAYSNAMAAFKVAMGRT